MVYVLDRLGFHSASIRLLVGSTLHDEAKQFVFYCLYVCLPAYLPTCLPAYPTCLSASACICLPSVCLYLPFYTTYLMHLASLSFGRTTPAIDRDIRYLRQDQRQEHHKFFWIKNFGGQLVESRLLNFEFGGNLILGGFYRDE